MGDGAQLVTRPGFADNPPAYSGPIRCRFKLRQGWFFSSQSYSFQLSQQSKHSPKTPSALQPAGTSNWLGGGYARDKGRAADSQGGSTTRPSSRTGSGGISSLRSAWAPPPFLTTQSQAPHVPLTESGQPGPASEGCNVGSCTGPCSNCGRIAIPHHFELGAPHLHFTLGPRKLHRWKKALQILYQLP